MKLNTDKLTKWEEVDTCLECFCSGTSVYDCDHILYRLVKLANVVAELEVPIREITVALENLAMALAQPLDPSDRTAILD